MTRSVARRAAVAAATALSLAAAGSAAAAAPAPRTPAAAVTSVVTSAVPAEVAAAVGTTDSTGLTLLSATPVRDRLFEMAFRTPEVGRTVHARVLLPEGYASATRRYPTLYLLHGTTGDHRTWTDMRTTEAQTAGVPVVVVMPEGGVNGEYTDWVGEDQVGVQHWESFHVGQLLPFVDAHLRTLAVREQRAIAGESMGGLGTMEYASRHPDLFAAAAPLSGAVSLTSAVGLAGVELNEGVGMDPPGTIYGPRATEEVDYRGHSPVDLAMNTAATSVSIYAYLGVVGPCDPAGLPVDPVEAGVAEMSRELDAALTAQGLPHLYAPLGPGTHTNPCFDAELALALPRFLDGFAHPAPAPTTVQYASTAATWSQWGWTVAVQRDVKEFSVLRDASVGGFALTGSGTATVTTPAAYTPGTAYAVTTTPSATGQPGAGQPDPSCPPAGADCVLAPAPPPDAVAQPFTDGTPSTSTVTAGPDGRLVLQVPLGPANTTQEYATPGDNSATTKYRTTVTVRAASGTPTAAPAIPVTGTPGPTGAGPQTTSGAALPRTGGAPLAAGALLLLAGGLVLRRARRPGAG